MNPTKSSVLPRKTTSGDSQEYAYVDGWNMCLEAWNKAVDKESVTTRRTTSDDPHETAFVTGWGECLRAITG